MWPAMSLLSELSQQLRDADCVGLLAARLSEIEARNQRWVQAYCSGRGEVPSLGWKLSMRAANGEQLVLSTTERQLDAEDMRVVEPALTATGTAGNNPGEPAAWLQSLRARHYLLTAHREDHRPGELTDEDNRAGAVLFPGEVISPYLLGQAAHLRLSVRPGLERAIFDSFGITAIHPFTNGNGRTARTTAWVELRDNHLQPWVVTDLHNEAITVAAHLFALGVADASVLINAWADCQLWTQQMDWRDLAQVHIELLDTGHIGRKKYTG